MSERQWYTVPGKTGILYREHAERKFMRRPDRFWSIRYSLHGERRHEMLGWASEGWTQDMAVAVLAELKQNAKLGIHPQTLSEKRAMQQASREEAERLAALDAMRRTTFAELAEQYMAWAALHRREGQKAAQILSRHIIPTLGERIAADITTADIDDLRRKLEATRPLSGRNKNDPEATLSPQTVLHCLKAVREVFNFARETPHPTLSGMTLFSGKNPVCLSRRGRGIRMPAVDNRRLRILTEKEIDALLSYTCHDAVFTQDLHDMLLLSLDTGIRAGELTHLRREDIDPVTGAMRIMSGSDAGTTKSGRIRVVHAGQLFPQCLTMLARRYAGATDMYIFAGRNGGPRNATSLPQAMKRMCARLGLNDGITDPRNMVVWHTLRHTYATMMLESGVDIYTLKELLGHSSVSVTERYLHLCDRAKREMALASIALGKIRVQEHR